MSGNQHVQRPLEQEMVEHPSDSQSAETDYDNDPHIYPNMWQFVFSIIGLCVGYGSFWRFPYLIYKHGGGVFLIPYLIAMVVVGVPCLYLQTAVGQMHRTSLPLVMRKIHPALKMLGVAILLASLHMVIIYNLILTYSYRFIFSAFLDPLPFGSQTINQSTYLKEVVLHQSGSIGEYGGQNWGLFLIYVVSILICHFIIKNGVKSTGNLIIYTASSPFVILFLLLVRGLFLDGAYEGLVYLFKPDWSKLWTRDIWIDSMVQVFYQFSMGIGTIVGLASMKPRRQNFLAGVQMIPLAILVCGLFSATTVFVYLSHFTKEIGMDMNDPALKISGPQLSFNVFPKALATLPFPNLLVFVFFCTMVLLGIDTQFGMLQALYCYLNHQRQNRPLTVFGHQLSLSQMQYLMVFCILVASPTLTSYAGLYYLEFYDYFISNIPFTLWVMAELYIFVYLFPFSELEQAIVRYTKVATPHYIRFFLEGKILLVLLGGNFLLGVYNQLVCFNDYSFGFYLLGWGVTLYPIVLSYWYFRKHWTNSSDLKLSFYETEHVSD